MNSLIPATDTASLWAVMAVGTAAAVALEHSFRWARRLSSPVVALLLAMLMSNLGVVPTAAPAYDVVSDWLVPLAIPLLLLRANVRTIFRSGGRLLLVFHLSALGTLLGTAVAVLALRGVMGEPATTYAAGLMAASYIGGGVNFVALQKTYGVPADISNPLIVADNFVMAGMFVALLGLATSTWMRARFPQADSSDDQAPVPSAETELHPKPAVSVLDLALAVAFAAVVVGVATVFGTWGQGMMAQWATSGPIPGMLTTLLTNKFVLLTGVTLTLATVLSGPLSRVNGAGELGTYFLLLFLFTLGLPADLGSLITKAPIVFLFCALIAGVNLLFTLGVGFLLRLDLQELLLAVNATLGGAPTAAAMAVSAGWSRLVLPGLLAGIWGYVIGTPIGILVVELLLRR